MQRCGAVKSPDADITRLATTGSPTAHGKHGDLPVNNFLSNESTAYAAAAGKRAGADLARRLVPDRQVGDLLKLDYNEALVVIHDHLKAKVGGLPLGTFLLA